MQSLLFIVLVCLTFVLVLDLLILFVIVSRFVWNACARVRQVRMAYLCARHNNFNVPHLMCIWIRMKWEDCVCVLLGFVLFIPSRPLFGEKISLSLSLWSLCPSVSLCARACFSLSLCIFALFALALVLCRCCTGACQWIEYIVQNYKLPKVLALWVSVNFSTCFIRHKQDVVCWVPANRAWLDLSARSEARLPISCCCLFVSLL